MIITLIKGQVTLPIDQEIRSRLENGCADTFLHIVPTDHARLKWRREYLSNTPNRAIAGLNIYTLENLVRRLYARLNTGRRHTGVGIQTLWTHDIMEQEQLPFLRPQPDTPVPHGTARQLRVAINQLKATGVEWHQLQEASVSGDGDASDKLVDLSVFYKAYETRLGTEWVDRAGIHRAVAVELTGPQGRAERLMQRAFPKIDLVIVSGFDVFFPHDFLILTGIANLPSVNMGIVLDFDGPNESLFGHIKTTYDQFLGCGFEEHRGEIDTPEGTRSLHFAQNLFCADSRQSPSIDKLDFTDQISLLSPLNRLQEVEEIAKLIKRFASSHPSTTLYQICVTFNDLDTYAPLIREVFPLHGIPYTLEASESLEKSTVVTSIFSLLERLQRGVVPQPQDKVWRSSYFHTDDWNAVIENCGLNAALSPDAFRESFDQLIESLNVHQQILKGSWESRTRFAAHKVNAFREFRRLIDELVEFLKMTPETNVLHPLESYIRWLKSMTSESIYQWDNLGGDGVRILPLIQTKDLSFDTVILGGLVDGDFPAVFRSDTFLPSKHRGTESDRLREDRFLFYQALTLYRKQLYLLSPQHHGDVELTPSAFIDELQRVAEINTDVDDDGTLFSTEDFLKNYGTYVWGHSETEPVEKPDAPSTLSPRLDLIAHNVRVEKSRTVTQESTQKLLQYEGHLLPNLLSESSRRALERRRARTYSVSQLETYGECPFRYFSNRVLNLKPDEEEEIGLTNLKRGSLAHTILFEFYDARRDAPAISEYTDAEFEEALRVLRQIAQNYLDAKADELNLKGADKFFWDIEAERLTGGYGRTGALPAFLEAEKERKFEVQPRYFEVGFGPGNRLERTDPHLGSEEPITVGDVSLAGRIDRVELGNGMFVIGDYKTGSSTPRMRDIREGRSLQLPLYIAVVEQLLRGQPAQLQNLEDDLELVQGVAGIYYVLQEEGRVELGIGRKDCNGSAFDVSSRSGQLLASAEPQTEDPESDAGFDEFRSVIDMSIEYANEYVRSIAEGDFQLTSHDKTKVCRYCSFKRICRVGVIAEDITA